MTRNPITQSQALLSANAETGKFYLEAVLNRIKKLEADQKTSDYTVYTVFQEFKAVIGEHGLKTVQDRMNRNMNYGQGDTYWKRFMDIVKAGGGK
jgi:hypothetical protein